MTPRRDTASALIEPWAEHRDGWGRVAPGRRDLGPPQIRICTIRASGSSSRSFTTLRSMHHYTTHPRGALSALRPLSAEVTVRGETGTMPRPRSLRRPCAAAPPFARRGPSGRFPRVVARTAALRLLTAHRAALRCLRARATAAIQQPETMRSPKFLGHPLVRTCPGSSTPAEPREQDLRDRQSLRIAPPVLPSETTDSSASTTDLSGPNSAAHALAVYASWSRSPVCFLNDHARLASGWRSCLGRAGLITRRVAQPGFSS